MPANSVLVTGDCLDAPSRSDQGLLDIYQKYTCTLKAGAIKQMNKAVATSYTVEPDASPCSQLVLANFVVLYFESVGQ